MLYKPKVLCQRKEYLENVCACVRVCSGGESGEVLLWLKEVYFYQNIMDKSELETQIVESKFTISEKFMNQNHIASMSYFTDIFVT